MNEIDGSKSRSARQLRSLWLAVASGAVLVVAAPFYFHYVLGFPLFSIRQWVTAGVATFAMAVPSFWTAFSRRSDVTGRMALLVLSLILLVAAITAWRFR